MTWQIRAGNGGGAGVRWAKWIDEDAALAHLRVMRSEVNRSDTTQLMGDQHTAEVLASELGSPEYGPGGMSAEQWDAWRADRYARQLARCRTIAEAIRGFALACDLDVFGLAPYAPGRLAGDDGWQDYPGLYTAAGAWRATLLDLLNADVMRIAGAGGDLQLDLYLRVDFTAGGEVAVRDDVIDPPSGSDRREVKTTDPHGWNPWSGWVVKTWAPGAGSASSGIQMTALAPLSLTWELLSRVARYISSRGIDATMSLSTAWVATRNARLSKVLGGTGLPRTIVEASAAADVQALGHGAIPESTTALIGAAVALATAINPVLGLVLGLLAGLAGLLYRVLPVATAYATDAWGHRQPFLQSLDLSGKIADDTAPTHAIPPPAYATSADVGDDRLGFPLPPPAREEAEPEHEPDGGGGGDGGGGILFWGTVLVGAAKAFLG